MKVTLNSDMPKGSNQRTDISTDTCDWRTQSHFELFWFDQKRFELRKWLWTDRIKRYNKILLLPPLLYVKMTFMLYTWRGIDTRGSCVYICKSSRKHSIVMALVSRHDSNHFFISCVKCALPSNGYLKSYVSVTFVSLKKRQSIFNRPTQLPDCVMISK